MAENEATATAPEVSPAVASIIESVEKLTVLELVDLVKSLEDKFGVTAAAPVAVAAMMPGAGAQAAAVAEEKTDFNVHLTSFGDKKIQVIKVVRELTGLGLKEAKDLVDGASSVLKEGVPKDEAQAMKTKLEEVGATIELK